jgi:hypothetical protein
LVRVLRVRKSVPALQVRHSARLLQVRQSYGHARHSPALEFAKERAGQEATQRRLGLRRNPAWQEVQRVALEHLLQPEGQAALAWRKLS